MRGDKVLSKTMTVAEFDAGYFYASDLKAFAREIGISTGNFRKIELENLIREFLATGAVPDKKPTLPRKNKQHRDPLEAGIQVVNYVGDKTTKNFLLSLVQDRHPGIKDKSGQWYWLNDWRRQQQEKDAVFTYQELADKLLELMRTEGRLPPIPSARRNNFVTGFRADPQNAGATAEEVQQAWELLKATPGPKTYEQYQKIIAGGS